MKTFLGKYPMEALAKYAGWVNLVMAFAFLSKLITLPLIRRSGDPHLFAFFVPFGLGVTLAIEGALGCLSLVVGLALLKRRRWLAVYPGVILCALVVGYQAIWGIISFNPHYRPPFKMMSIMMPAASFVFLVRLSKGEGRGHKKDGSKTPD